MNKPLALEKEHIVPLGTCWRSWSGAGFSETLRQTKENSGDEASFSMGVLRKGAGGRGPLLGKLRIYKGRF
jgi:hypothetical protein